MSFEGKVLAEGQLPSGLGTLYTVPAGKVAYIKFFSCFNTNAGSENVFMHLKPGSTSRCIERAVLAQNESVRFIDKDEGCILEEAGTIEGYATDAAVVDYIIMGIEETI